MVVSMGLEGDFIGDCLAPPAARSPCLSRGTHEAPGAGLTRIALGPRVTRRVAARKVSPMFPPRAAFAMILSVVLGGCASDLRPSRDGNPDTGGVEGVVVDNAHRGIPKTSVTVFTSDPIPRELGAATTDYAGRFLIERLPPGNDRVLRALKAATVARLRATREHLTIVGGKIRDLGEIELTAGE